ncbi:MAG TPA: helix-turn-helix domain-containing protein [Ktedonobacteraceae bacterium]|nr:helix-turn-helix domain-containing protein [Ktedonobacteraceae bacterium]
MEQYRVPGDNQPITLQQKQTLIAVYQQTGNMTRAMREAGIRSPRTAYLWWHRYCESGESALEPRSHARKTQQRLPASVVEQICQLRNQEPHWGRRRIADELAQAYGRQVVSPASVEAVLRRAGLWENGAQPQGFPQSATRPAWLANGINYERLLATVQEGIRLSVHSEARAASQLLYRQVWAPIEADPALLNRLLAPSELSSWLLNSRLQLGHSLMNSGHWSEAVYCLRETIAWMQEQEQAARAHRRLWEDEPHFVSLRRDDIWLGCYHHLGLTLGKEDLEAGLAYLQTALNGVQRSHRPLVPGDPTTVGSLERDLANLKLRLRSFSEVEVRQHLLHAQQNAEETGVLGVQAYTCITWGRLYDRLARATSEREKSIRHQQREHMQRSVEQALQLVETEQEDHDRPMRQAMCYIDTALLAQSHSMPIDGERLRQAAQNCLTHGYGHQAGKLLAMPDIHLWMPEDIRQNLISFVYKESS